MKISYNWLQDFITTDLSIDKISEVLTNTGLEVEGTKSFGISKESIDGIVVGNVVSCVQHPNADRLKLTKVDIGANEPVQIVCGAANVREGLKVPVATVGTTLTSPNGDSFKIKKAKLRGEASHGMICSQKEIGISDDNSGIWELDTDAKAGTPVYELLDTNADTVFEIGLTPNRADAMSHFGVARDFYAATETLGLNANWLEPNFDSLQLDNSEEIKVENNETELAPNYRAIIVKGIKVKDSPQWLKDRLLSIGLNPKNNVVDITNYVLHTLGQPMHAFDLGKIQEQSIKIRKATLGATLITLDSNELKLSTEDLIISDDIKPLALAGVMGGLNSAVTADTKAIVLECAYFNPISVRRSAKRHAINSDSSFRFERGIDPEIHSNAIALAIDLLKKYADASEVSEVMSAKGRLPERLYIDLRLDKTNQILGDSIPKDTIIKILKLLDFEIISDSDELLQISVPTYRVDVTREIDVIEEILRIYGYNSISSKDKFSFNLSSNEFDTINSIENKLATLLVNSGYNEAMNVSLVNEEHNLIFQDERTIPVPVINSLSAELSHLRLSLLPGLLKNVSYNFNRKTKIVKLFELGNTYIKGEKNNKQKSVLSIIESGATTPLWNNPETSVDIYDLIQTVDKLLNNFNISYNKANFKDKVYSSCVRYTHNNTSIATCGVISDDITKSYGIDKPVHYAEVNLQALFKLTKSEIKYKAVSKYPQVERDLALVVDNSIEYATVLDAIESLNEPFLKTVSLFDVYEGDKIPDGKKSFAINLTFMNDSKTLKDKDIDSIVDRILKTLESNHSITLRN